MHPLKVVPLLLAVAIALVIPGQVLAIDTTNLSFPSLQAEQGFDDPSLALGLSGIADWQSQMPFINHMKSVRVWIGHTSSEWGAMSYDELKDGGYLDQNGWPTSIPTELQRIGTVWSWSDRI